MVDAESSWVRTLLAELEVEEIGARDQGRQTEAGVVEGHALDVQGRPSGLVEHQLQGVAVQQVDAVEGGVLRRRVDLRQHVVVLRDQVGAGGLRVRIDDRSAAPTRPAKAVAVPPTAPIVEDAASFDVTMVITPVVEMLACRLLAASAALRSFSVATWPPPVPKVIEVGVPPPVAAIVSVWPVIAGGVTAVVVDLRPGRRSRARWCRRRRRPGSASCRSKAPACRR